MWKKILLGLVVVVVIFLIVVALQPAHFSVKRSANIQAPPERVFAQINDFKAWNSWSPWAKLDPNCKYTFGETSVGEGATYAWEGDGNVGSGNMTITESKPAQQVDIRLEFIKPFPGLCPTQFTFKPEGGGAATQVTWTMSGEKNFISKAMCLFMSMDKMVGGDFEKGLANIKEIVEAPTRPATAPVASASPK
jgi:hypothetical protein